MVNATKNEPQYHVTHWDGTNSTELADHVREVNWGVQEFAWSVEESTGDFRGTGYYWSLRIPAGYYYVAGPYWGGETYGQPGGDSPGVEIVNPLLYANKFTESA